MKTNRRVGVLKFSNIRSKNTPIRIEKVSILILFSQPLIFNFDIFIMSLSLNVNFQRKDVSTTVRGLTFFFFTRA